MRAWKVHGQGEPSDVLRLAELDPPTPGPGMLRLEVAGAAIGFPDVLMCRGAYPLTPEGDFTPGQEVAGTVTAVGDGVDPSLLGQRVMAVTAFYLGHGGFADQALAAASTVFSVPDDMADDQAAAFTIPYHTGWIALHARGDLQAGETLLVLGAAGGSGAAAIQIGVLMEARVIAVVGGADKAAFCTGLGADVVIDHRTSDVTDAIGEATDGRGVDVIFDPVGGQPALTALRSIANEGRHLLVGFASGEWASPTSHEVAIGNHSLVGVYVGAYDHDRIEIIHNAVLAHYHAGHLASIVTERVGFDDLPGALDQLAGRSVVGKAVMIAG